MKIVIAVQTAANVKNVNLVGVQEIKTIFVKNVKTAVIVVNVKFVPNVKH